MMSEFSEKNDVFDVAQRLGELLVSRGLTCSVAESCTGGMIGAAITAVAGASVWFSGGVIAYSNRIKERILGVSPEVLLTYGAVSAETVSAMAEGVAACIGTDCAVSVSGIAGPSGGSADKPVGLVYIGVSCRGKTATFRHLFDGDRETVRHDAVDAALGHLIDMVQLS